jgi:hypothetical protein
MAKPFRLGAGDRIDSHGVEKDSLAQLEFHDGGDIGLIEFNGTDWDVSVNGSPIGSIPGSGSSSGGFEVSLGSGDGQGPILPTNTPFEVVVPRGISLSSGWKVLCKPSGSITIDIRKDSFPTIPDVSDSITGSNQPSVSASTSDSGDLSTWTSTSIAQSEVLQIVITANTGVRWFSLQVT